MRKRAHKPLPPFGRELISARRQGVPLNVFVHAGAEAWRRAKHRRPPHVLCLPDDAGTGEGLDWSCVAGLELVLVVWDRPPEFVDAVARLLVRSGAAAVVALGGGDPDKDHDRFVPTSFARYVPETRRRGAA